MAKGGGEMKKKKEEKEKIMKRRESQYDKDNEGGEADGREIKGK